MTKFDALKQLPVERFADLFYDMCHKAESPEAFRTMLLEEFTEDMVPALQKCSTGADLLSSYGTGEGNNNSHHNEVP